MRRTFFCIQDPFHAKCHCLFEIMNVKICLFIFKNSLKKSLSSSEDHERNIAHISDAVNGSFQNNFLIQKFLS